MNTKAVTFREYDPRDYLLKRDNIVAALVECIRDNDLAGFIEVILAYLEAMHRSMSPGEKNKSHINQAIDLIDLLNKTRLAASK